MRAAVYTRISRDIEGQSLGVARQEAAARERCATRGWEVVAVYSDNDTSAYSGKPRPGFERMLAEADTFDVVVAWAADRLYRHPADLEHLVDRLQETGTTVETLRDGVVDLTTESGRMTARILGAVSRQESERKSARLRAKHAQLAEAGKIAGGGHRPFGFEPDRVTVRADEAEIIVQMADRVLAGDSLRSICRWLAEISSTTTAGKPWTPTAVRRVLTSARVAGMREHRGEIVSTAVWPAVIPLDDLYRLRAVLGDPARRTNNVGPERKLLTGTIVCHCGTPMVSRPRADGTPCYVCPGGSLGSGCSARILGEPVDDLVVAAVLHRLDSPTLADAMNPQTDDERIVADLEAVADRRAELAGMWAAGEIGRREWQAAGVALDRREQDLMAELSASTTTTVVAELVDTSTPLGDRWPDLSHDRHRTIIAAVVDQVVIGPGRRGFNRFDPSRVSIRWKA